MFGGVTAGVKMCSFKVCVPATTTCLVRAGFSYKSFPEIYACMLFCQQSNCLNQSLAGTECVSGYMTDVIQSKQ